MWTAGIGTVAVREMSAQIRVTRMLFNLDDGVLFLAAKKKCLYRLDQFQQRGQNRRAYERPQDGITESVYKLLQVRASRSNCFNGPDKCSNAQSEL
jgi:hypothetical protein